MAGEPHALVGPLVAIGVLAAIAVPVVLRRRKKAWASPLAVATPAQEIPGLRTMLGLTVATVPAPVILLLLSVDVMMDSAAGKAMNEAESGAYFLFGLAFFFSIPAVLVLLGTLVWGVVGYSQARRGRYQMTTLLTTTLCLQVAGVLLTAIVYLWSFLGFWE